MSRINFVVVGIDESEILETLETILPVLKKHDYRCHIVTPDKTDFPDNPAVIRHQDRGEGIFSAMDIPLSSINEEEFVLFINAGDRLNTAIFLRYHTFIHADLASFGVVVYSSHYRGLGPYLNKPSSLFAKPHVRDVCHQSLLYKAKYHKSLVSYRSLSADRYFMLDLLHEQSWCYRYIPIATFNYGGISSSIDFRLLISRIRLNGLGNIVDSIRWIIKSFIGRKAYNTVLRIKFFTFTFRRCAFPDDFNVKCFHLPGVRPYVNYPVERYESSAS